MVPPSRCRVGDSQNQTLATLDRGLRRQRMSPRQVPQSVSVFLCETVLMQCYEFSNVILAFTVENPSSFPSGRESCMDSDELAFESLGVSECFAQRRFDGRGLNRDPRPSLCPRWPLTQQKRRHSGEKRQFEQDSWARAEPDNQGHFALRANELISFQGTRQRDGLAPSIRLSSC
jgi:hypothetical protein